jgi:hypothetical protein
MPVAEAYRNQVALLIKTVPLVAAETAFALKVRAISSTCGTCSPVKELTTLCARRSSFIF